MNDKALVRFEEGLQKRLSEFREWLEPQCEPKTIAAYFKDAKDHLVWLVQEVPDIYTHDGLDLSKVTSNHLRQYEDFLEEKSFASSTIGRKRESLRQFYKMAVEGRLISTNPVDKLSPRKRSRQEETAGRLTRDQYKDLFTTIDLGEQNAQNSIRQQFMTRRDRAIISLMVMHGLRVEEISKLDVAQVDFESDKYGCLVITGRGSKRRSVFLSPHSRKVLQLWLDSRGEHLKQVHRGSSAVFLSMQWSGRRSEDDRITPRGIRAMVDGYLQKIGAKDKGISCDALRDDYMTLNLSNPELEIDEIVEPAQRSSVSAFDVS